MVELAEFEKGARKIHGNWADMTEEEESAARYSGSGADGLSVTDETARSGGGIKIEDDIRSPPEV